MSYVRECFSKSVLLGTLDNPLRPKETCEPSDISEEGQKVFACLCENDYCNSYRSPDEPRPSLPPLLLSKEDPRPAEVNKTLMGRGEQEDVSRIQGSAKILTNTVTTTERQVTAARKSPLRCHSCGNLFNPEDKCEEFSVTREEQEEECEAGEVCLLYMWHKSVAVTAAVRHCFPETILLGERERLHTCTACQLIYLILIKCHHSWHRVFFLLIFHAFQAPSRPRSDPVPAVSSRTSLRTARPVSGPVFVTRIYATIKLYRTSAMLIMDTKKPFTRLLHHPPQQ